MRYQRVAYVCGPYRALNGRTVLENIRAAEAVAIDLWRAGYVALCPHLNTAHFDGLLDDEAWLEGGLTLLSRCDLLVTVDGWELSAGSREEVEYAEWVGIPIMGATEIRQSAGLGLDAGAVPAASTGGSRETQER